MEQMCSSTRDCTDGIRACGALRQDAAGDVAAFCAFPNSGGAQLGSSCTNNVDCRDGLCLGVNNECSVACALDSDCSTAANQVCSSLSFSATNNVEVCMRSCVDNSSCNGGDVCTINSDIPNDDIDQVCAEPSGAGQLGALCATGNDCITGLCLTTTTFDGRPCTTDAQCTGGAGNAGKTCECPVDQPNCTTGKQCASAQNRCSRICNDNADCIGGITGNPLNACSTDVNVTRPSGNGVKLISMCGEN